MKKLDGKNEEIHGVINLSIKIIKVILLINILTIILYH